MTIYEIIEREKWLAEDHEMIAESYKRVDEEKTSKTFKESAEEHKQLAEWLEELKDLKSQTNSISQIIKEYREGKDIWNGMYEGYVIGRIEEQLKEGEQDE